MTALDLAEPPLPGGPLCPQLTAHLPGIGGVIAWDPAHFIVEEIPAYLPSGEGDHFMVQVRKEGLNSATVRLALGDAAGVEARNIGMAGRKDRHAVTTQWFSLPKAPVDPEHPQITLLAQGRHPHKLRTGHLKGNHFTLRITDVHPDTETRLPALLEVLRQGMPNYYGGQRFGRTNLPQAMRFLANPQRRVKDPRFLVSTLQSAIFNRWLGARIQAGQFHTALQGDILKKRDTGGLFECEDPTTDALRVAAGEVDPTGPMYGPKLWTGTGEGADQEHAMAELYDFTGELPKIIKRFAGGSRRVARLVPEGLSGTVEDGTVVLKFTLPKGAYATVLLNALMHGPARGPWENSD